MTLNCLHCEDTGILYTKKNLDPYDDELEPDTCPYCAVDMEEDNLNQE